MKLEDEERLSNFLAEILQRVEKLENENEELRTMIINIRLLTGEPIHFDGSYAMRISI